MHAISFKNYGGPEELTLLNLEPPTPGPEQLLVRVRACGVNRADVLQRRGHYPQPFSESTILGLEIAGEVISLGHPDLNFQIGDRVFGLVSSGAYAEYCLLDKGLAMPIPENLSFVEGACIAEAFLTAQQSLFALGNLQANESVLIHAGASGVGSAAIQLAKQLNATIFTTVSNNIKTAKVKSFGANYVINYKEKIISDEILASTHDQGVDMILDFVGAAYLDQHLHLLKTEGRLIMVGLMGGKNAEINLGLVLTKRLQIKGLTMRSQPLETKRLFTERFMRDWLPLFEKNKLFPIVDSVYAYQDVAQAHQRMEANLNIGKIILEFN